MRRLAIVVLEQAPHSLYWIELAALRGQELEGECLLVKELVKLLRMMDPEIIQNHYGLGASAFALEIFYEGREGAHIVAACKNGNRDQAVL